MSTPLTLYPTNSAAVTVTTDNTMVTAAPSSDQSTTTRVNNTAVPYWVMLWSQGNAVVATQASEFGAADQGWLYDSIALEGQILLAGSYMFKVDIGINTATGTATADIHCLLYKRSSAGVYTQILDAVAAAQSIVHAASVFSVSGTTSSNTSFGIGDKLLHVVQLNVSATANLVVGSTFVVHDNVSGNAQIVTPGYISAAIPAVASSRGYRLGRSRQH